MCTPSAVKVHPRLVRRQQMNACALSCAPLPFCASSVCIGRRNPRAPPAHWPFKQGHWLASTRNRYPTGQHRGSSAAASREPCPPPPWLALAGDPLPPRTRPHFSCAAHPGDTSSPPPLRSSTGDATLAGGARRIVTRLRQAVSCCVRGRVLSCRPALPRAAGAPKPWGLRRPSPPER